MLAYILIVCILAYSSQNQKMTLTQHPIYTIAAVQTAAEFNPCANDNSSPC